MEKEIILDIDGFDAGQVVLVLPTMRRGAVLLCDDAPVPGERGTYVLADKHRRMHTLQLKARPLDPVPKLLVDGEPYELVPPFRWYDYLLMALPVALIYPGGILGGALGFVFLYANSFVLRQYDRRPVAYAIVVASFLLSVVLFLLLSIGIGLLQS